MPTNQKPGEMSQGRRTMSLPDPALRYSITLVTTTQQPPKFQTIKSRFLGRNVIKIHFNATTILLLHFPLIIKMNVIHVCVSGITASISTTKVAIENIVFKHLARPERMFA